MSDDFRVKVGFFDHPKTIKLSRRVGSDGVVSFLRLIGFCSSTTGRGGGNLCGLSDEDIEIAARWDGEQGQLVSALVEVRYLDGTAGERSVHDFAEHNPFAAGSARRSFAARKANHDRWAAQGRCNGGTEFCTGACGSSAASESDPNRTATESVADSGLIRLGSSVSVSDPVSDPVSVSATGADRIEAAFGRLLASRDVTRLRAITPAPTSREVELAIAQTREKAARPGAAYCISVLETMRTKGKAEATEAPPPYAKRYTPLAEREEVEQ